MKEKKYDYHIWLKNLRTKCKKKKYLKNVVNCSEKCENKKCDIKKCDIKKCESKNMGLKKWQ